MQNIPLGFGIDARDCHRRLPQRGEKLQKLRKPDIDECDEDKEDEHDDDDNARGFERVADRGPCDALELGKRLFEFSSDPHEDVGLFGRFLRVLLGRFFALLLDLGFFFSHDSYLRYAYLDSL